MKFNESQLEQAFISLLQKEQMVHQLGNVVRQTTASGLAEPIVNYGHIVSDQVLIEEDLSAYLRQQYQADGITENEIESIIRDLDRLPSSDLYESNKAFMKMVSDGFLLKREDRLKKDIYIQLIDYSVADQNIYKIVNQLAIKGYELRIPDLILYINGLPLVVFEFKSAIKEDTTIYNAYKQLTVRYKKDIPELFKYNAFCVISDGVNTKSGSFFAPYEFFYAWRKIEGMKTEVDGIDAMFTLIHGMFNRNRLRDIIRNFIYLPDSSKKNEKIVCRYPQYYATVKLFENIKSHQRPHGDGKGGTYFGTTGCGKSYTMLFLSRMLMKSSYFGSPTIILITDRTDLDDQLSGQFTNAKGFIGDETVISVESRSNLRELLQGRNSGGVFLTTIHKFTEDTKL
ncbi:MAG: type I restriction endonuclease subunit R, partial [Chitinophagaceae bacterium]